MKKAVFFLLLFTCTSISAQIITNVHTESSIKAQLDEVIPLLENENYQSAVGVLSKIINKIHAIQPQGLLFTGSAPSSVVIGETFRLTYIVNTHNAKNFRVGDVPNFDILMGPTQSASSGTLNVNGQPTSSKTLTFTCILRPKNEGTFTIPSATITANGNLLRSEDLIIKVLPKTGIRQSNSKTVEKVNKVPSITTCVDEAYAAYMLRAYSFVALNLYKSALEDYNMALECRPSDEEAFFQRGQLRIQMDDIEGGIEDLKRGGEMGRAILREYDLLDNNTQRKSQGQTPPLKKQTIPQLTKQK